MDDGQGWPDYGLVGRRTHGSPWQGPRRTLSRPDGEAGNIYYTRIDAPATPALKATLGKLSPRAVRTSTLVGEPIIDKLTRAPGNDAPIGGLKVPAQSGWFAARPSGTENIYKLYAESFRDPAHLDAIVSEAREMVNNVPRAASA